MSKRVIITGQTGYVAQNLFKYLTKCGFEVKLLNVRNNDWKTMDFSETDILIHAAALLHNQGKKSEWEDFKKINIDLTKGLADKAKAEGVSKFIFFSTMHVYGLEGINNGLSKTNVITSDTPCNPQTLYAKSKYLAEQELQTMQSQNFSVLSLRCPMIYGKYCPGNYRLLRTLALKVRVVPDICNHRSLLHIDNLCSFIEKSIENETSGIAHPQDKEYICTTHMMEHIASINNVKLYKSALLGVFVKLASIFLTPLRKAFGNLVIDQGYSNPGFDYHIGELDECMKRTEPWEL